MAVEPLMKRQESDVTDAPKAPKIQHTKTLPSEESVEYRPEQDFLDALNEDSSTMKTEEKACENCEGQNGEEEN